MSAVPPGQLTQDCAMKLPATSTMADPSNDGFETQSGPPGTTVPASVQPWTASSRLEVVVCGGRGSSPEVTPLSVTDTVKVVVEVGHKWRVAPVMPSLHLNV